MLQAVTENSKNLSSAVIAECWYCDSCGGTINSPVEGMVEWFDPDHKAYGLRLVHHDYSAGQEYPTCQSNARRTRGLCDDHLDKFLGPVGMMRLSKLLLTYSFESPHSVLLMLWRLHVPGYEQARPYFDQAVSDGIIDSREDAGYTPYEIQLVLEKYC